jgi:hypothetical protein
VALRLASLLVAPRRRLAAALICCCLLAASGCESKAQKCEKARVAAESAWGTYVQALEQARASARSTQADARSKLGGDVEHRLAPGAQKVADGRYPRSSEAWLRAYRTAYEDACAKDDECNGLRQKSADAKILLDDFVDRVPLAQAAQRAASGDVQAAKAAAKAVIVHPEFPQWKQAQALTLASYELCKDLPPPKPTEAQ